MALVTKFTNCLKNKCTTLSVTDTTGVYNVTTNLSGWGVPNAQGSDILSAILEITNPNGDIQLVDVTSQIPNSVIGSFTFNAITITNYVDGVYTIKYTTISTIETHITSSSFLLTCKIRSCVDKMWATIACKSCGGSCDLANLIDDANLAEGLLRSIESGATCCDATCINKILTSLSQICAWEDCNC